MLNFSTWLRCWLTALGSLHCNRTCFPFLLENYLSCDPQHHATVLSPLTFYPMFERPSMITDCINYEVGWIFSKCKSDHNFSSVIFHYYREQSPKPFECLLSPFKVCLPPKLSPLLSPPHSMHSTQIGFLSVSLPRNVTHRVPSLGTLTPTHHSGFFLLIISWGKLFLASQTRIACSTKCRIVSPIGDSHQLQNSLSMAVPLAIAHANRGSLGK